MCLSERLSVVLWFDFFLIRFQLGAILSNILAFILRNLHCRYVHNIILMLWLSHITLEDGLCCSDLSGLANRNPLDCYWVTLFTMGPRLRWGLIGLNKSICLSASKISLHRQCEVPHPFVFSPVWLADQNVLECKILAEIITLLIAILYTWPYILLLKNIVNVNLLYNVNKITSSLILLSEFHQTDRNEIE